jgi:hypothetical protein
MPGMDLCRKISSRQRRFLKKFTEILDGPRARLLEDLFAGISVSGSTLLTQIARALKEPIDLIYTEKRLSRGLGNPRFDVAAEKVAGRMLELAAARVREDEVIAVDVTDLAKPYARAMEDLCTVWDGSAKEATKGYWLYESYRVDGKGQPHILQWRPYSTTACDFLSANSEFMLELEALLRALGGRGVLVMDRGCDRRGLMDDLLEGQAEWIIRQTGRRMLVGPGGCMKLARTWAGEMLCDGRRESFLEVRLPGSQTPLWLVAAARDGEPLMLLCRLGWWADVAVRALRAYGLRWRAEDAMRAAKQGLGLEKFLVRTMFAIRGMVSAAALVLSFAAELVATDGRLCKELLGLPHRIGRRVKVLLQPLVTAIRCVEGQPP